MKTPLLAALAGLLIAGPAHAVEPNATRSSFHLDLGGVLDGQDGQLGPAASISGVYQLTELTGLGLRLGAHHRLFDRRTTCRPRARTDHGGTYTSDGLTIPYEALQPRRDCTSKKLLPRTVANGEVLLRLGRHKVAGELGIGLQHAWRPRYGAPGWGAQLAAGLRIDTRPLGAWLRFETGIDLDTGSADPVVMLGFSISPRRNSP